MGRFAGVIALGIASFAESGEAQERGSRVTAAEYEGWRQYSVHCARCHGQDVLGNPVAANLLESTKQGGPVAGTDAFARVVAEGRPERGMPAFEGILSAEQMDVIYAYVKGRADARIAPGRPTRPSS